MADHIDHMEQQLLRWAAWIGAGGRGDGYPATNVLHHSWLPPAPGTTPTMKVSPRGAGPERTLHDAIKGLSTRLQNTLVVVYVMRVPQPEQARRLECSVSTVDTRVREAKRQLLACR